MPQHVRIGLVVAVLTLILGVLG